MEDQLSSRSLLSISWKRKQFEQQMERIKKATNLAQYKIDYSVAHNESTLQAIEIVEEFLRKKHRICYGGQAINAHLPEKYKFYHSERTVPDYDFFSPQPDQDIRNLVQDLKKAGFQEISAREGMHEGTVKIYVDYIPIADITAIDPSLYRILSKREYRVDGISYMDVNTLRMMMYLELSRPRGEVERWPKVYERLLLLNTFASKSRCRWSDELNNTLTKEKVEYVINFLINKKRIFAGLDLVNVYRQAFERRTKKMEWLVHTRKPILFFSPNPEEDMKQIREEFERQDHEQHQPLSYRIRLESSKAGGELLPTMTVLYQNKIPLLFIIHQSACHSYFQLPFASSSFTSSSSSFDYDSYDSSKKMRKRGKMQHTLQIASMDTLITLYFSLALLDSKYLDMGSMECLANHMLELSIKMRTHPKRSPFPFISLNCSGHQKSLPSLIREKVHRITERKKKLKTVMNTHVPLPSKRKTVRKRKHSFEFPTL